MTSYQSDLAAARELLLVQTVLSKGLRLLYYEICSGERAVVADRGDTDNT